MTGERYERAVLDIPEPWGPLPALSQVLEPGHRLRLLADDVQVQQFVLALPGNGFQHIETFETLKRGWHVTERSVRPDHRMVVTPASSPSHAARHDCIARHEPGHRRGARAPSSARRLDLGSELPWIGHYVRRELP